MYRIESKALMDTDNSGDCWGERVGGRGKEHKDSKW